MKITRNVNGEEMEFELTWQEVYEVCHEHEHESYVDEVRDYLEDFAPEDRPELTEDQIDRVASLFEAWQENNDLVFQIRYECLRDAIRAIMQEDAEV